MQEINLKNITYSEGCNYMRNLCSNLKTSSTQLSFCPTDNITIFYPGKKKNGDYRMEFNGIALKHTNIVDEIYNLISSQKHNIDKILNFLISTYNNGLKYLNKNEELQILQYKIFWITLQEEINYPRSAGYAGINLAFCRYIEALFCNKNWGSEYSNFTLNDVKVRCENNGRNKPKLYTLPKYISIYKY